MDKVKAVPRFIKEIILTVISYVLLWVLWNFILKEYIQLSDQGLSTIGLALSASLGVLTAIVVSFVLITWQSSRQERSAAFWRWRNALHQLVEFFDTNLEVLWEIREEVTQFTFEASAVSLISPMPFKKLKELSDKIGGKIEKVKKELQGIKKPSKEEVAKGRVYMVDMTNYLVVLTTANFEHRLAHYSYTRVLSLRGLLYRLLVVLTASILGVAIGVISTPKEIPDISNAPLAIVLIGWFIYVLVHLGREIKRVSRLEDALRRQEEG